MTILRILAATAATVGIAGLSVPALAQTYYPNPYAQPTYPQYQYPQYSQPQYQYPQQAYPQAGYAYPGQQMQGQNAIGTIINQLLGNRYNVTDRTAVQQCATAAMAQAAHQYQPRAYGQAYGYNSQAYHPAAMRVTAITDVRRRSNGLRVSGLMSSGMSGNGYPPYGQAYGYHNQAQANGDLTFRCNVAYNGQVTNVRIGRNTGYRG